MTPRLHHVAGLRIIDTNLRQKSNAAADLPLSTGGGHFGIPTGNRIKFRGRISRVAVREAVGS